jgi:spore coat polysaccharide biosynthesis protein SpsF
VVKAQALLRAEAEASLEAEREHVCPYLYNHPELFRLHRPLAPFVWQHPEIRLTVDTPEDYAKAQRLHKTLETAQAGQRVRGETIIAAFRETFSPGTRP